MTAIKAFIKSHPVLSYFVLTFVISWGGVFVLGTPYGMPTTSEQFAKVWYIVFIPYFLGPAAVGILMTGLISGRAGFHTLGTRLTKWRVSIRWFAVALLTAPLVVALLAFVLSLVSKEFLPVIATAEDKVGVIVRGIMVGLIFGGFLEELGWTGFAVPKLRQVYSIFATGLIVGVMHGLWHVLPTYWGTGDASGALSLTDFIPPLFFYAGVLTAYRILMVWVYDRTESLFICMLMHASLTASAPWILLPAVTGTSLVIFYIMLTVIMWALVGIFVLSKRQRFESRVSQTR